MENTIKYKSKATYSLSFKIKEIIYFSIAAVILIFLLLIFLPPQIKYIISTIVLILFLIFLGLGILIMKTVLGVVTQVEGDSIRIYMSDSFLLRPEKNELIFQFGRNFHASGNFEIKNLSKIRRIDNSAEINELKNTDNVLKLVGVRIPLIANQMRVLLNKSALEKISLVSDYDNIVEFTFKKINIKYPLILGEKINTVNNTKLLVSIKNPDEFINLIKNN